VCSPVTDAKTVADRVPAAFRRQRGFKKHAFPARHYLYIPELVDVFPSFDPPSLALTKLPGTAQVTVTGQAGQVVVIEASPDFSLWGPIATNRLASPQWNHIDSEGQVKMFYRARLRL
jgi:hypothetical protein